MKIPAKGGKKNALNPFKGSALCTKVFLDDDLHDTLRAHVGPRGVSGYIRDALKEALKRDGVKV